MRKAFGKMYAFQEQLHTQHLQNERLDAGHYIKLKRDIFTSSSRFHSLRICRFALTPRVKIKKLFQKAAFFPSGKAVQVFHIIVLTIFLCKGGEPPPVVTADVPK